VGPITSLETAHGLAKTAALYALGLEEGIKATPYFTEGGE